MRRVVITGMGIVSPIGNTPDEVEASLRAGKSGITFSETYAENGFRSQIHGVPDIVRQSPTATLTSVVVPATRSRQKTLRLAFEVSSVTRSPLSEV